MTRTLLLLAAGAAIGVGGLTLAQTERGHGKGLTVKTLSAVDVNEELNGPIAVDMAKVRRRPANVRKGNLWR
jgi:hypothetical protein